MPRILVETNNEWTTITFQSSEDYNAFSLEFAEELYEKIQKVISSKIPFVLFKGQGPIFSSGANIKKVHEASDKREFFSKLSACIYESFFAIRKSPQIFISAVHGKVIGVALPFVLCTDLIWAQEDTLFIPGYLNLGLFPNGGLTFLLPELLGNKRALELLLVQKQLSAQEAYNLGLISAALPKLNFKNDVEERMKNLLKGPVVQYQKTKELFSIQTYQAFESHLRLEREALLKSCGEEVFLKLLNEAVSLTKKT